jgi:hypothetical protein
MATAPINDLRKACPSCGKVLRIKREQTGKKLKCSNCESVLRCEGKPGDLVLLEPVKAKSTFLPEDANRSDLIFFSSMLGGLVFLVLGCLAYFGVLGRWWTAIRFWGWEDWALFVGLPLLLIVVGMLLGWITRKHGGPPAFGAGLDHWGMLGDEFWD